MNDLYEILYCSELAADQNALVVPKILGRARPLNVQRDITGVLIFDGMRFCQHFEGPRDAVMKLMDAIKADPRHVNVEVVYHGRLPSRRYRKFSMGYAVNDEVDEMASIEALDGERALARFLELLPRFDVAG